LESVRVALHSTDKVINASITGGSIGFDLAGSAALDACRQAKERLAPFATKYPTFAEQVNAAYMERVPMSIVGFYKSIDDVHDSHQSYFTYGVAATEVEVDLETGDYVILRTDIIMDLGQSPHAYVDIGQIEGGFIQGLGLACIEEFQIGTSGPKAGYVLTRTTGYKIPTAKDIPKDFRVHLLSDSKPKEYVILSSRGVGEPPLALGFTAHFAILHALGGLAGSTLKTQAPLVPSRILERLMVNNVM